MKNRNKLDDKPIIPYDVPLWKRFAAYMVDWYAGYIFTSIPMVLIYMKLDNTQEFVIDLYKYPKPYALIAGCAGLLFALFYYTIVPLKIWNGQTLGKHWLHFKIVKTNGENAGFKDLILRQVVGFFLLEGALIFPSRLFYQILSIACNVNLVTPFMYIGYAVSIVSAFLVMFRKDHKAIHDLISGTRVMIIPNDRKEA